MEKQNKELVQFYAQKHTAIMVIVENKSTHSGIEFHHGFVKEYTDRNFVLTDRFLGDVLIFYSDIIRRVEASRQLKNNDE